MCVYIYVCIYMCVCAHNITIYEKMGRCDNRVAYSRNKPDFGSIHLSKGDQRQTLRPLRPPALGADPRP